MIIHEGRKNTNFVGNKGRFSLLFRNFPQCKGSAIFYVYIGTLLLTSVGEKTHCCQQCKAKITFLRLMKKCEEQNSGKFLLFMH